VRRIEPSSGVTSGQHESGGLVQVDFSVGAGIIKDRAKAPSAKEGVLWTNKYAGK